MTTNGSFDRRLAAWLETDAEGRVPDHLTEILVVTRATRQRPWWSSLERWLAMDTTLRLAPIPRLAWLVAALALLIAVAITAIYVGMVPSNELPPFGPAANGVAVYGSADGDIYAFDPTTGTSRALITGPTVDRNPLFAPDGSKFAFLRLTNGASQVVLANADGTVVRVLQAPDSIERGAWSPDSSRLAVVDASGALFIVNANGSPARRIDLAPAVEDILWRPDAQGLVLRGVPRADGGGLYGLYRVRADGTDLQPIVAPAGSSELYQAPALSPDGTRILFTSWGGAGGQLWVVDTAGGIPVHVDFDGPEPSDYFAQWSPDGDRIVLHRGEAQVGYHLAVGPATGGSAITIGPEMPWGPAAAIAFSPDGSQVLARYDDGVTWIHDAAGSPGERLAITTPFGVASWQRVLAPQAPEPTPATSSPG